MAAGRLKLAAQVLAVAFVAGLLALLAWKLVRDDGGQATGMAPAFTLPRLDEEGSLSLASLRGKAVILNFWASWCEPCKEEAPLLESAWRRHRAEGVVVVGVDAHDFKRDARRFVERYGITYPIVHDGRGSTLGRFGISGFPETLFVNREGKLVGWVVGEVDERALADGIAEALEGS